MSSSRLLTVVRDRAAVRRYSPRTTQAYVQWIVRYVRWNGLRHPAALGGVEVRDFLTYLARERHVAASTQNQALAALQFLYRDVLAQPLGQLEAAAEAAVAERVRAWAQALAQGQGQAQALAWVLGAWLGAVD